MRNVIRVICALVAYFTVIVACAVSAQAQTIKLDTAPSEVVVVADIRNDDKLPYDVHIVRENDKVAMRLTYKPLSPELREIRTMLSDWHENTKGKYGLTTEQAYLVTTETYTGMVGTDGSIKWNKLVYTGADVKVDVTGVGFDADIINKAGTETYLTLVGYAKSLKGVK